LTNYVSAIFLDFDNVFSSLFKESKDAAREFATAPARWLGALQGMKGNDEIKTCYPPKQLDAWAKRLQLWASGGEPDDLSRVDPAKAKKAPRDVFAYVIHEGKVRAPAGAMELIQRVT